MKKSILVLSVILACLTFSNAQSNINNYKYVIVPNKFDFLKEADKYQLNSLTKFLFNKYGFISIMEDEVYLQDLVNNSCLALRSDVIKIKGFINTKLGVVLKNCKNENIFTSEVKITQEKDFKTAYTIAIRSAFKSLETLNYTYKPNKNVVAEVNKSNTATNQQMEKLKEEIKMLKEDKLADIVVVTNTEEENEIAEEEIVEDEFYYNAIPIDNGFELRDNLTNKVKYIIYSTNLNNVYIIKGRNGIIYKNGDKWVREFVSALKTSFQVLDIKF